MHIRRMLILVASGLVLNGCGRSADLMITNAKFER